ncbi:MAG: dihydrodipicolinate synthase family protein [Phycisphaerae bacterium]|nr:dihydrodipicolinate synthase family protein [Phycisphaerae bacterium]
MPSKRRRALIVPMVTPVTEAGELDDRGLRRVVDHLLAGGVDGVFVAGTTGESASLSVEMRSRLVASAVEKVAGRAGVYASISGNNLPESLAAAREFLAMGVDALVAHLPSYFTLSDQEQYEYFKTLLDKINGPLIIYNIPQTTNIAMTVDVLKRLADHPNAAGVKDSATDPTHLAELLKRLSRREDFTIFVGNTALASKGLSQGAAGFVPSAGNLAPTLCRHLYEAVKTADWSRAKRHQAALDALGGVYQGGRSLGQSIAALKALMHEASLCGPSVLPPLQPVNAPQRKLMLDSMKAQGLSLAALAR